MTESKIHKIVGFVYIWLAMMILGFVTALVTYHLKIAAILFVLFLIDLLTVPVIFTILTSLIVKPKDEE